jgi:hypothetical protein
MDDVQNVSGAFTWKGLAVAVLSGAATGALAGLEYTGGTLEPEAVLAGALTGGISYLVNDLVSS